MHRLRLLVVSGVVPWIASVPPPHVAAQPAAPCRAAALRAELGLQGATGSLAGGVVLTNRGHSACSLRGTPEAKLLGAVDAAGVKTVVLPALPRTPGSAYPSLRSLRPGESAFVRLSWSNWCGAQPPARLALDLDGAEFDLRVDGSARCDAPAAPSTLAVGPLEPRELLAETRLPLAAAIVEHVVAGKRAPGVRGSRGRIAVFHVALTNTSTRPFRFGRPCPTYAVGAGFGNARLYVLNCGAVGSIAPGQSVVFEMRVRVPTRAAGRIPLTWTLAPATTEPPFAAGVIVVR